MTLATEAFEGLAEDVAQRIIGQVRTQLASIDIDGLQAFSVQQTSKKLGIGERSVHRLIETGDLRHVKAGARILIPASSLRAFLEQEVAP